MSIARVGLGFLLVAALGCGGKILEEPPQPQASVDGDAGAGVLEAPEAPPPPPVETDAGVAGPNLFQPGDDWHGTYTCPQGLTELDLRIVSTHDDVIDDALFIFDWTAGGANGSFHLQGTFDPSTRTAVFTPNAWVDDPGPTWRTVGMTGTVDGDSFRGNIDSPTGCGTFSVTKP